MRSIIYLIALILLCACSPDRAGLNEDPRPNVLIFLVDDLGKEWISAYGAEDISTPHIDALVRSGLSFNNVYSMPQCTPTRVTMLTGQYPFRHGWVNHWDVPRWGGQAHFDESMNPSLGMEMKKAGYATCIAGKWQIDDFRVEPDALSRNGFDAWCMWTGYETGVEESAERYQDPYIFTREGSRSYPGEFGPDIFKDFIIKFIHEHKEGPMFIYYPMVLTHTPLVNTPLESAPDKLGKHKAMVRYTDLITGEIVRALKDADVLDNTVVIWTTDNGTTRGISGNRNGVLVEGGKALTTEPGICAPFIVSWPGTITANTVTEALVDFTDIFPTCLDLAGVEPVKEWPVGDRLEQLDGYSFKDVLLRNSATSNREWILSMGGGNNARLTREGVENQYIFRDRVLRNERYKLYINTRREADQFYDLRVDPQEAYNLMDSLSTPERVQGFEKLFEAVHTFPEQDNDPRYRPNPGQSWDVPVTAESQVWKQR
jgi:arylsulfatase A-like enzyme